MANFNHHCHSTPSYGVIIILQLTISTFPSPYPMSLCWKNCSTTLESSANSWGSFMLWSFILSGGGRWINFMTSIERSCIILQTHEPFPTLARSSAMPSVHCSQQNMVREWCQTDHQQTQMEGIKQEARLRRHGCGRIKVEMRLFWSWPWNACLPWTGM